MPTVTFTSKGYAGTINPGSSWARAKANAGGTYGVVGPADWKPTIKPAVDRTALIAAGSGFGAGIDDTTDIAGEVTFGTLTSGTRYDLIVARRVWGSTNATSFVVIAGSSTRGLPARSTTPGTQDDQPIGLARIDGGVGGGTLAEIIDLRVWQANGGAFAADDLARSYMADVGTTLLIGNVRWTMTVDGLGNPVWKKGAAFNLRAGITGTAAPATAQPLIQAFPVQALIDSNGLLAVVFPEAFAAPPVISAIAVDFLGVNPVIPSSRITTTGCSLFWASNPGVPVLVNVIAVGWK